MSLTAENYYGITANKKYLSVSQYKDFFGTLERKGCEAQALAIINGEFKKEPTAAMLIGSYIDSYFEGTLEEFKERSPQVFKKDGSLKSDYIKAEEIIKRIERDPKFLQYLSGEKQVIMTAELFGVKWKIKMDSYLPDKAIVDLKIVDEIYKKVFCEGIGKLSFIQARGYDFQLAIYQKVVEIVTGKLLPCYIAAADKGKVTNIELIKVDQKYLDSALIGVDKGVQRIKLLKSGKEKPARCKLCDFCKETKIITSPILLSEMFESE